MVKKARDYTEASESHKGWARAAIIIGSLSQEQVCDVCHYKISAGESAIKEAGKFRHRDCEEAKREAAQREKEEKETRFKERRKKIEEKKKAAAEKKAAREAKKKAKETAGTGKPRKPRQKKEVEDANASV
ncbi:MAG: hypothetical protein M0Q12_00870 [Synergistaceae bacterium]|jgi:hypothetical protein|nr:hypothetical protein [Synergistaceae bacterium]